MWKFPQKCKPLNNQNLQFSGWIRLFRSSVQFSLKKTFIFLEKVMEIGSTPSPMENSIIFNAVLLKPSLTVQYGCQVHTLYFFLLPCLFTFENPQSYQFVPISYKIDQISVFQCQVQHLHDVFHCALGEHVQLHPGDDFVIALSFVTTNL